MRSNLFRRQVLLRFLFLGLIPMSSSAIVVRDDRDQALFVKLAQGFPSTVMLCHGDGSDGSCGEGTLIDRNWVLTAAHIASYVGPGDPVTILGKIHKIERIVIYPDWHRD